MTEESDLRSLSLAALLDLHLKPELTEARGLVEVAAAILRLIDDGEVPVQGLGEVTGPLVEALGLLRQHGARECPGLALPGLTEPTGRGAWLVEPGDGPA